MSERVTNWAGNIVFAAQRVHRPGSVNELQELLARAERVRVLGSGHSFNRMADTTGDLISLAGLPRTVEISGDRRTVRVDGGIRYGDLVPHLDAAGLALHNLASLPHISVAGAVATATHGSGERHGNLATAVAAIDLVRADGQQVTLRRGDRGFTGAVVGLGALGVITSLTLDVVPAFEIRQYVYDDLAPAALEEHLPEILAAGYSVSIFTNWASTTFNDVWVKRTDPMPDGPFFGARPADG
jgi:xylitol oxidase